jgi:hypothetical protein
LNVLVAILILVLVAAVVAVISGPLRAARAQRRPAGRSALPEGGPARDADRDELLAAREAKYREIRDAELDYRTGKLSREDYEAIDRGLRAEAIAILDRLEAVAD